MSVVLVSCNNSNSGFVKTELGFSFKRCTHHDSAPKAKEGDILLGEMKIMLNNKTLISSNYGSPDRLFKIMKPRVGSIDEFLMTLHIGDSAIMIAPADSVMKYVRGVELKPKDKIYFYITISQIISKKELTGHDKEVADRQQEFLAPFCEIYFVHQSNVLNLT